MEITYFKSFLISTTSLIIFYIFNWFKFRTNLNFLTRKLFECCCPCCCKKRGIEELKSRIIIKNSSLWKKWNSRN